LITLDGKVALVTGGASGTGAATAALLARLNAALVIADIDEPGAAEQAAEIERAGGRVLAVTTNVRDEDQIKRAAGHQPAPPA